MLLEIELGKSGRAASVLNLRAMFPALHFVYEGSLYLLSLTDLEPVDLLTRSS